jgi:hypothetical protein
MRSNLGYIVAAVAAAWGVLMLLKVKIPYLFDATAGNAVGLIGLAVALSIGIAVIKKNSART